MHTFIINGLLVISLQTVVSFSLDHIILYHQDVGDHFENKKPWKKAITVIWIISSVFKLFSEQHLSEVTSCPQFWHWHKVCFWKYCPFRFSGGGGSLFLLDCCIKLSNWCYHQLSSNNTFITKNPIFSLYFGHGM